MPDVYARDDFMIKMLLSRVEIKYITNSNFQRIPMGEKFNVVYALH